MCFIVIKFVHLQSRARKHLKMYEKYITGKTVTLAILENYTYIRCVLFGEILTILKMKNTLFSF